MRSKIRQQAEIIKLPSGKEIFAANGSTVQMRVTFIYFKLHVTLSRMGLRSNSLLFFYIQDSMQAHIKWIFYLHNILV